MTTYTFKHDGLEKSFIAPVRFDTKDALLFIANKFGKVSDLRKTVSIKL